MKPKCRLSEIMPRHFMLSCGVVSRSRDVPGMYMIYGRHSAPDTLAKLHVNGDHATLEHQNSRLSVFRFSS